MERGLFGKLLFRRVQVHSSDTDGEARLDAASRVVLRLGQSGHLHSWTPSSSVSQCFSPLDHAEYLAAVDEIIRISRSRTNVPAAADLCARAKRLLWIAMSRLKNEFRYLMIWRSAPLSAEGVDLDDLIQSLAAVSFSDGVRRSGSCSIPLAVPFPSCGAAGITFRTSSASLSFPSSSTSLSFPSDSSTEGAERMIEECCMLTVPKTLSALFDAQSPNPIFPEGITRLREIADRMVRAGVSSDLCEAFIGVRRMILSRNLAVLKFEAIGIEEVQRPVEFAALGDKIVRWVLSLKAVVGVVLPRERWVCDQILTGFDELKEECFLEVTMGCVRELLASANMIASMQCLPEKFFHVLGTYEMLLDVAPNLVALFADTSSEELVSSNARRILRNLASDVRGTLNVLDNLIMTYTSKKLSPGDGIHQLTGYLMNYIRLLMRCRTSLNLILHDESADTGESVSGNGIIDPCGRRMLLLISRLEAKLKEMSDLYEHMGAGMQYIFLMNNTRHIVQKVQNSELELLLGGDWVSDRQQQINQYVASYHAASWGNVLSYLTVDGLDHLGKEDIWRRFKNFSLDFMEVCSTQTTWNVPDPELRQKLRTAVMVRLLPAYRAFFKCVFHCYLKDMRHSRKCKLYASEELEEHLSDLFEGSK